MKRWRSDTSRVKGGRKLNEKGRWWWEGKEWWDSECLSHTVFSTEDMRETLEEEKVSKNLLTRAYKSVAH